MWPQFQRAKDESWVFFILHWVELTRGKNVTVKQKKSWNQGKRINKHKTDTVLLGKKGLDFQSWAGICTLHVSAQWQDISELAFHWPFFPAEQVTFFFFLYFSPLPKDILSFLLIFGTYLIFSPSQDNQTWLVSSLLAREKEEGQKGVICMRKMSGLDKKLWGLILWQS